MKVWFALVALFLLLALVVRERFEATDKIKDPSTWTDDHVKEIRKLVVPESTLPLEKVKEVVSGFWPTWKDAQNQITMTQLTGYLSNRTDLGNDRQAYLDLLRAYYIQQGQDVFQKARGYVASYSKRPTEEQTTPSGSQPSSASTPSQTTPSTEDITDLTCPSGYTLAPSNAPFGLAGKCTKSSGTKPCPEGEFMPGDPGADVSKCVKPGTGNAVIQTSNVPTCPSGQIATPNGCMLVTNPQSSSSVNHGNRDREANRTTGASWSASLGGGSSGNLIGPTSGGTGSSKLIWGPVFTGLGEDTTGGSGDTTKSNQYPELMGGLFGKTSSRIPGVGIVSPSQPGLDTSVLPSSASTGTDANARFLPFSRQPGDMDIVPDPYRLASSYSTKNYAPQKDPVPFLTDFSAFFK